MHPRIEALLLMLQQSWGPRAWHGTALKGAVRGVSIKEALWRPGPGRRNIWELVLHLAYWKYAATRRLTGRARGSFPREGSNWIAVTDPTPRGWKADVELLHQQHAALIEAVRQFPAKKLGASTGSKWTYEEWIAGVAAHDLYHTGQLQLIKKLSMMRGRATATRS
jgi:hypothetical protein